MGRGRTSDTQEEMRESLVIAGTLLPVVGIGATALLATATSGMTRWMILTGLPALTLALCWLVIDPVWNNGNLLAAVVYMSYVVALLVYYPLLMVASAVTYYRTGRCLPQRGLNKNF